MSTKIDRVGKRYGRLLVLSQEFNVKGKTICKTQCDCGVIKEIHATALDRQCTVSCGCYNKEKAITHGMYKSVEYKIYHAIKSRCYIKNNEAYPNYGGRDIIMSDSWLLDFSNFIEDMGPRPTDKHTIERVNVNLGYNKENCIWTDDRGLQSYNSRKRVDNNSGKTGVCWYKATNSWSVEINKDKTKYFLGYYKDLQEAISVREAAEIKYYGFIKD